MSSSDSDTVKLRRVIEFWGLLASAAFVLLFSYLYFYLGSSGWVGEEWKAFLQSIITNIIPVHLLFVGSYFLLRQVHAVNDRHDAIELAKHVATELSAAGAIPQSTLRGMGPSVVQSHKSIKSRDEITSANKELISGARNRIISFSGDLSWTDSCHQTLLDAVTQGISVRLLCKEPLTDESKRHIQRYYRHAGIQIRYYPPGLDPDVRGLMTDPTKGTQALFVEKQHRTLGDAYSSDGHVAPAFFEYWGQRYSSVNDIAILAPLGKLFDIIWQQSDEATILEAGDWGEVERELKQLPQYRQSQVRRETVKIANLKPLHKFVDKPEYRRIRALASRMQVHGLALWDAVTLSEPNGRRVIPPPIIEFVDHQWVVIDGLARVLFARELKMTEIIACVIEKSSQPLPGQPWTWDQVQLVEDSDYKKEDNFNQFNPNYWRDLHQVHRSLQKVRSP